MNRLQRIQLPYLGWEAIDLPPRLPAALPKVQTPVSPQPFFGNYKFTGPVTKLNSSLLIYKVKQIQPLQSLLLLQLDLTIILATSFNGADRRSTEAFTCYWPRACEMFNNVFEKGLIRVAMATLHSVRHRLWPMRLKWANGCETFPEQRLLQVNIPHAGNAMFALASISLSWHTKGPLWQFVSSCSLQFVLWCVCIKDECGVSGGRVDHWCQQHSGAPQRAGWDPDCNNNYMYV